MSVLPLYNSCLQKVSILLREGMWKSRQDNPFSFLPSDVVQDLASTTLRPYRSHVLRAADLELLLTSGRLREFKIGAMNLKQDLGAALKFLTSASQNLEFLTVADFIFSKATPDLTEALENLLRNSPNLKYIHSEVEFDLKVLRNCKKLRKILLHFKPNQPWYDFLEEKNGCLQPLNSLELFRICYSFYSDSTLVVDYIVKLLMHCPALTSLADFDTSRTLALLHRKGILPHVKLRHCVWSSCAYPDCGNAFDSNCHEWIRDAVIYHPFVEELYFHVYSSQSIAYLSSLKNLVFLDIRIKVHIDDLSGLLSNALKDVGYQLKHLFFESVCCPMDISVVLQNRFNLEALGIGRTKLSEFSEPAVSLPNLKHLTLQSSRNDVLRVLPLLSDCHNLTHLFVIDEVEFDDQTLDKFLRRNSLSNLKIAYFRRCSLSMRGFRKFLLNAPELEKMEAKVFYAGKQEIERRLRKALLETNHKALGKKYRVSIREEFFLKKTNCKLI